MSITRAENRRQNKIDSKLSKLVDLGISTAERERIVASVRDSSLKPGYLLTVGSDPKTIKGEKQGYLTGIMYLTPANGSGFTNLCVSASLGCKIACLNTSGHGNPLMGSTVQRARLIRTAYWQYQRANFWKMLIKEINSLIRKAYRRGLIPVVRLNGTSDILFENTRVTDGDNKPIAKNIMSMFTDQIFYDYTKHPIARRPDNRLPGNYHLTFSRSETNHAEAIRNLEQGRNVTVVFSSKKGQPLPEFWNGYPVKDGDENDLRFKDPVDVVIGLHVKGYGKADTSGFVELVTIINGVPHAISVLAEVA